MADKDYDADAAQSLTGDQDDMMDVVTHCNTSDVVGDNDGNLVSQELIRPICVVEICCTFISNLDVNHIVTHHIITKLQRRMKI